MAAGTVLMGVWWMTEALPIPATALIPLVVFPVFDSQVSVDDVGAKYGDDIIFLSMGGFLLALAMPAVESAPSDGPVATPPNAVAYGSGYVTIGSMIKGGIWLNLIGIVLVTLTTFTLMAWALGIQV